MAGSPRGAGCLPEVVTVGGGWWWWRLDCWMLECSRGQSQACCLGNSLQNRFLCISGDCGIFLFLLLSLSLARAQRGEAHLAPQRVESHQNTERCLLFLLCPCAPIHHGGAASAAGCQGGRAGGAEMEPPFIHSHPQKDTGTLLLLHNAHTVQTSQVSGTDLCLSPLLCCSSPKRNMRSRLCVKYIG